MKKILIFARDPGGANVVLPLIKPLKERYQVLIVGKDVGFKRLKERYSDTQDITQICKDLTIDSLTNYLQKEQINFIITGTSADDNTEKYLWAAGKQWQIPSFAILDQWVNYGIRFSKYGVGEIDRYQKEKVHEYLPTKILVMDALAKTKMLEEGIPEEYILISGQPYLDDFSRSIDQISWEKVVQCKRQLEAEGHLFIVFASEPIIKTYGENAAYWGYTEATIFSEFCRVMDLVSREQKSRVTVTIRPHPKENVSDWESRIKDSEYVTYKIDQEQDGKVLIKAADLICGMSSMFLLEAAICQKQILSIQIGLCRDNPFVLHQMLGSVTTREQLKERLERFFQGEKEFYQWEMPKGAIETVIAYMEEYL